MLVETARRGCGGARARSRDAVSAETATTSASRGSSRTSTRRRQALPRRRRAVERRRRRGADAARAARGSSTPASGRRSRAGVNRGHVLRRRRSARRSRRTYAVMGDTVNLAARLTARARAGRDPRHRRRARPRAHAVRDDAAAVPGQGKGASRSPATRVGAAIGEAARSSAPSLPLVGREAELARARRRRSTPRACGRAASSSSSASRASASRGSCEELDARARLPAARRALRAVRGVDAVLRRSARCSGRSPGSSRTSRARRPARS